ncbi:SDR family oxidoreductase [Dyella tabacisoli]|uniref:SDR family NAD(P)-dependent oxidoreductase n=1 Tax=Dyella tabacisoli TaxID=2282381 RepID=A0A369UJU1_9GAMM|nr:SDR family oxidoreductase [Dyella tabacisoli]RDD79988.1 SDR family NAD(P)-dependent oxidoreductase [Dyella tabacisoli]
MPRIVLITGASSGIGKSCAQHLQQRGYRVYGTSRGAVFPNEVSAGEVAMIPMDVRSQASVEQAVQWILAREGRLDIVVNNAGNGIAGAIEDTSIAEAQAQFDTNFFGMLRVCHATLPVLRRQGSGYLINVSSIAGRIGVPFQGLYSASKFAIEGLTEVLRAEVRPYGVRVALIEPGDFHTGFTVQRCIAAAAQVPGSYSERFRTALSVMEKDETRGATPEAIAQLLERIINTPSPKLRHLVGPAAQKLSVSLIQKLLPQKTFEAIIDKYYGIW